MVGSDGFELNLLNKLFIDIRFFVRPRIIICLLLLLNFFMDFVKLKPDVKVKVGEVSALIIA